MKLFAPKVALQRYTPPTCTLEVRETRSRLGEKDPTPKNGRFTLYFDDPRLPEEKQVSMEGDREQLDRLCEVVNNYVQNFLEQTFSQGLDCPESPCYNAAKESILFAPSDSLSLAPKGLFTHTFCFGLLESVSLPNPMMELSTSQLFDLTNALEAYGQDVLRQNNAKPAEKNVGDWMGTALISLVAIGLVGIGLKVIQNNDQRVESLSQIPPIKSQFSLVEVLPPVPPAPSGKPVPNLSLAPKLSVRDPLPAPGTVQAIAAPPRNPTVNLAIPPLRVLPPNPIVPPAPPQIAIASPNNTGSIIAIPSAPANNQASLPINNGSMVGLTAPPLPSQSSLSSVSPPPSQLPPPLSAIASNNSPQNQYNLLDTIPQVAEARQYFQERWQPPNDLTQTLEYQLLIKPDGSLDQSIPLGKAATLYLAKLPLPAQGTPFLSPLSTADEQTLRLVLSPNGRVRTFLE